MSRSRLGGGLAVLALLLVAGCAEDESAEVVVDVRVTICAEACRDLPAAGADVTLLDEAGTVVASATADSRGRARFTPGAGTFSTSVEDATLDLRTSTPGLQVPEGGSVDHDVSLGTLEVTPAP